jgi:EAL and modified HD-GYP domain-containing signal transduction protein
MVGRQPILNRYKETIGYELLYRSVKTAATANFRDGNMATSLVFANTLFEMGLESIVGTRLAFINFTRDFLVKEEIVKLLTEIRQEKFLPQQVVLEVLEDISLDNELFVSLHQLKEKKYIIALDDVSSYHQIEPILDKGLVDLIKIDLMAMNRVLLPDLVNNIKQYGILLLAEKVETQEDFSNCYRLGFDFFQGYFFYKPETIKDKKKKLDISRLNLLRSLAATMNTQASFQTLEPIISQDLGLSYKLLRLVNSGYYSLVDEVKSIKQAISLIGLQQLRSWMLLLMMATVDDKPHELTTIALQRAKMCEIIGKSQGDKQPESFFLIGLLSALDAVMDMPMEKVVENLSLAPELAEALINRQGKLGLALTGVMATEMGNWDYVLQYGIKAEAWQKMYLESIKWSNIIMNNDSAS